MKNIWIKLLIALISFSFLLNIYYIFKITKQQKSNKKAYSAKVTKIIDGDTFDTEDNNRIRLAEIDAPEFPKDCYSAQAKERLGKLISNKKIFVEVLKKDNFGRLLSFVYLNNLLVNKALVAEGYAVYSPFTRQTKYDVELKQAELEAKEAKRGIWSNLCQNTKTSNCLIKGNYRKDKKTKIYHLPNCYNYQKITINEQKGDRWFCTEEEATKAGFIKSKDCP